MAFNAAFSFLADYSISSKVNLCMYKVKTLTGLLSVSAGSPRGRIEQRTAWPTETGTMVRILKRSNQVSSHCSC